MTSKELAQLARERLWIAEVGFDPDGSVTFNAEGLGAALDASRRMLARGRPPGWVAFGLFDDLELAEAACDAMEAYLCRYVEHHGQPKPITLRDQLAELVREWKARESEEETKDEEVTASDLVAVPSNDEHWEH